MGKKDRIFGSFCAIMTGVCWGVSGVFGQFLFETRGVTSLWLVPIRMFSAGLFLLCYSFLTPSGRPQAVALFHNKRDLLQSILAGVLGTMMFQLSFFLAVQNSNAGTATVLQYLCPVITMLYVCLRSRLLPTKIDVLSIILALSGIFLISTHGNFGSLVITPAALFWGIATAFFMFLNTVIPEGVYKKYPSTVVLGYAFVCGGLALIFICRPWRYHVDIDLAVIISMAFIILGGSVAAYMFYGNAIKRIGSAKSSLFASSEPVAAALLSAVWLKTSFSPIDLVGFVLIISTLFILTLKGGSKS
ncbi:MAG: DMT family transporter [Lachnospiraceae bacterium]|nr:DMT family transporter [Lachnospiraceae bacterium]